MQIFNRRILALETNAFLTKGVLVQLVGKTAKLLKKYIKIHATFSDEWLSETQLTQFRKAIEFFSPDVEDYVVLNFPFEKVISSVQQMPDLSEDQLRNAIKFKMSEDFTLPASELIVEVARPVRGMNDILDRARHLAFATKRKSLEEYMSKLITVGKSPEPDILLPDNIKYFELMDERAFHAILKGGNHFAFLVCMDLHYSVLFSFLDGKIYNVSEIPISLFTLLEQLKSQSIDVVEVLTALVYGTEIGSLAYIKQIEPILDDVFRTFLFESEKNMRIVLNNSKINNAINQVDAIFISSLNHRLTLELETHARNMKVLNDTKIYRLPIKADLPEDMDTYRTAMGFAYRGIREIGKYTFKKEGSRGGKRIDQRKLIQKEKTKA